MNRTKILRIFSNRNYALYFSGQFISQVGTWMQQVALSWLTYSITKSPFLLTLVAASSQLPSLVLMPIAGVVADRFNRHRLLIVTQTLSMIQAAILAFLTLNHTIQVWQLLVLGLFGGVINAFDMPTRQVFIVGLVEGKEDLSAAIGMNSSLTNITRVIGPALAGFIVAAGGESMCFLANAVSYIAVLIALFSIKGNFQPAQRESQSLLQELEDGWRYVMHHDFIRTLIVLPSLFFLGGMAYMLLMPVLVKQIGGNADTLGYLMSASALGSVLGALLLASRRDAETLPNWVVISSFTFSLGVIALSLANSFWLAALVQAVIGASMILFMGSSMTMVQTTVDEDKRGRVMALFTTGFMGGAPIGGVIAGAISDHFGFSAAVLVCGVYCLVVAIFITSKLWPAERRPHSQNGQEALEFACCERIGNESFYNRESRI